MGEKVGVRQACFHLLVHDMFHPDHFPLPLHVDVSKHLHHQRGPTLLGTILTNWPQTSVLVAARVPCCEDRKEWRKEGRFFSSLPSTHPFLSDAPLRSIIQPLWFTEWSRSLRRGFCSSGIKAHRVQKADKFQPHPTAYEDSSRTTVFHMGGLSYLHICCINLA